MFALLAIPAAINGEYIGPGESITVILGFVSIAMFFWAGLLHYKVVLRDGANLALLHLMVWLGILMVILPNLTMILLLYGGKLAAIVAPFGLLILLTGSMIRRVLNARLILFDSKFMKTTGVGCQRKGG